MIRNRRGSLAFFFVPKLRRDSNMVIISIPTLLDPGRFPGLAPEGHQHHVPHAYYAPPIRETHDTLEGRGPILLYTALQLSTTIGARHPHA